MADVRGYVYEHRLVASQKLGRSLHPFEQVHHINGVKTDNRPENLEVLFGMAEHALRHRVHSSDRRMPCQSNPIVQCACGCEQWLTLFDGSGRRRRYLSGHNTANRNSEWSGPRRPNRRVGGKAVLDGRTRTEMPEVA